MESLKAEDVMQLLETQQAGANETREVQILPQSRVVDGMSESSGNNKIMRMEDVNAIGFHTAVKCMDDYALISSRVSCGRCWQA